MPCIISLVKGGDRMAFTMEQKIEFIYKVVIKLAQENRCLPYSEIWMHQYQITNEDLAKAKKALSPLLAKGSKKEKISYRDMENALIDQGWDEVTAKAIIGIVYFEGESSFQILDEMTNVPSDVKRMMKKAHW